jgi:hypothetical protein
MQPSVGTESQCMSLLKQGRKIEILNRFHFVNACQATGRTPKISWLNHIGARKEMGRTCNTRVISRLRTAEGGPKSASRERFHVYVKRLRTFFFRLIDFWATLYICVTTLKERSMGDGGMYRSVILKWIFDLIMSAGLNWVWIRFGRFLSMRWWASDFPNSRISLPVECLLTARLALQSVVSFLVRQSVTPEHALVVFLCITWTSEMFVFIGYLFS